MNKSNYWSNDELEVFWFAPGVDRPEYLECSVENLGWNESLDGRDLVCLKAQLPITKRVLNLEFGGTLEIVEIIAGPRDDYKYKDAVAFRASTCFIQSRSVIYPVIRDPQNQGVVTADVWLSCKLEIEPDE